MTTETNLTPNPAKERQSRKGDVVTTARISATSLPENGTSPRPANPTAVSASPIQPSKSATVLKLLGRAKGATIAEIGEPTGWQPHSARAYLSGLRKKGLTVIREQRRTGETTYRIVDAVSGTADPAVTLAADTTSSASSNNTEVDGTAADSTDGAGVLVDASTDAGSTLEAAT